MPVVQQGSINTTALIVPDIYVQIVPPQNLVLNGVPTDIVGAVGTASWGPVNQPVIVASMANYAANFGPVMARKYDMGTQVATAVQQGAQNFRCVRVTDGTDAAASAALLNNAGNYPLLLTARYSGSAGNNITVAMAPGAPNNSWTVTITMAGFTPEVFANLPAPNFGTFWTNLVNAINAGQGPLRGPSQLVVASAGTAGAVPPQAIASQALTGGADGANGVNAQTLLGVDTLPRRGLYALRGQGCAIGLLADADDTTTWTTQAQFGLSEGVYMIINMMLGTLAAMATSVVSYWVGSSAGSARKEERLAQLRDQANQASAGSS